MVLILLFLLFTKIYFQSISDFTFRRNYTIESTSSSGGTNVHVLISIDTNNLKSNSKLEDDCRDIRFRVDSTWVRYWTENSCSDTTSLTRFWVEVPSIGTTGTKLTIQIYYGDPGTANGEEADTGNFYVYSTSTCTSGGWSVETTMHETYLKYTDGTFGNPYSGGNVLHTHIMKGTSGSTSSDTADDNPNDNEFAASGHTHNWRFYSEVGDANPPHQRLHTCRNNKFDVFLNSIHMFDVNTHPGFTHYDSLDGEFPYGSATCCVSSGSHSHSHTWADSTNITAGTKAGRYNGESNVYAVDHKHYMTGTTVIAGINSNIPEWYEMIFAQANAGAVPNENLIVLSNALPPLGWELYTDGANMNNRFIRGHATTTGGFGGTPISPHDHTYTATFNSASQVIDKWGNGAIGYASEDHVHAPMTNQITESELVDLPYFQARFYKRITPIYIFDSWGIERGDECDPGYYKTTVCTQCPPGTYKTDYGDLFSSCVNCNEGTYSSSSGRTSTCTTPCTDGYYCPPGSSSATQEECPVGNYCKNGGLKYLCPGGEYNNVTGVNTDCIVCEESFYCPNGSVNPIPCDPSHFCPVGSMESIPCECNGHGACYPTISDCHCFGSYGGSDCNVYPCFDKGRVEDGVCSDNGICTGWDECSCYPGYLGSKCQYHSCSNIISNASNVCSGHGKCNSKDVCVCDNNFVGTYCSDPNVLLIWFYVGIASAGVFVVAITLVILLIAIVGVCVCCCYAQKLKKYKKYDKEIELIKMEEKDRGETPKFELSKKFFQIESKDIKLIKKLGAGSYAEVFLCKWNSRKVAMKLFQTTGISTGQNFEDFEKELAILSSISHPNILHFYGCSLRPPRVGIILEYCSKGDLCSYILEVSENNPNVSLYKRLKVLEGIVAAMIYLHKRDIVHRDLKPGNVLINEKMEAKLCDFGLSRVVENSNVKMTRHTGTSYYMAPEVTLGKKYNTKCDVFSFAIIMHCILHLNVWPYDQQAENIELNVANNPSFRPKIDIKKHQKHKWYIKLMKKSWSNDDSSRPTFLEIQNEFSKYMDKKDKKKDDTTVEKQKTEKKTG